MLFSNRRERPIPVRIGAATVRQELMLAGAAALALALGVVFALLIRPGTPYDEPAHFTIVQYYSSHLDMPVIGRPGVSYEGQNGPIYYALAGSVYKLALLVAGARSAFYAVRIAGLVLLIPMIFAAYELGAMMFPRGRRIAFAAALFMAANPMLVAMASSVQDDILSIDLSMLVLLLCVQAIRDERLTAKRGALVGLLIGVAILTKATAAFFLLSIPLGLLLVCRRRGVRFAVCSGGAGLAAISWWLARNFVQYGDLTARTALVRYGFTTLNLHSWKMVAPWLSDLIAYYWTPSEYSET